METKNPEEGGDQPIFRKTGFLLANRKVVGEGSLWINVELGEATKCHELTIQT